MTGLRYSPLHVTEFSYCGKGVTKSTWEVILRSVKLQATDFELFISEQTSAKRIRRKYLLYLQTVLNTASRARRHNVECK